MFTRPALALLLLVAIILSGCGRRGALEDPGEPEKAALLDEAPRPGANPAADEASPGATEPAQTAPGAAPERRFILDPLI